MNQAQVPILLKNSEYPDHNGVFALIVTANYVELDHEPPGGVRKDFFNADFSDTFLIAIA